MPTVRLIIVGVGLLGCAATSASDKQEQPMVYRVKRAECRVAVAAEWNAEPWRGVESLELRHFMGQKPDHFPRVQAKLTYDDRAVYVIFHVDDRYVRAVAKTHQGSVCLDSCVEFFFTPARDVSKGYFNLEMNCGGTMLFNCQPFPERKTVPIADEDLDRIEVAHSMSRIVDPEIDQPTQWTVSYRLPLDILDKYFPNEIAKPAPGVVWRANIYKCADATSHPHWLTWSPVVFERPNFHLPEQFGTLLFD